MNNKPTADAQPNARTYTKARQTCYTPEEAELVAAAIAAKVAEAPPLPGEAQRLIRAAVTKSSRTASAS